MQFLKFRFDAIPLQRRQIIDKQLAIEVIDLVLDADGEQAISLKGKRLAIKVLRGDANDIGALYGFIKTGHG